MLNRKQWSVPPKAIAIHLNGLRNVVVAFTDALVSADLGVLALSLLHQCLQLGIIRVRDSLRLHLDVQLTTGSLDALADVDDGLLQSCDTEVLVQTGVRQDIERWRYKPNLHLVVFGVPRLGRSQRGLDGVDPLIFEAGDLNIRTNLGGLGRQALSDVRLELLGNRFAGECDVIPDVGVPNVG